MRPLRLRMRGFGAFRDETEVDFTDTDVFALVGPTGAGKSTVIDALCFALYGSVPRHGEKLVEPVVSVGANEAAVELTFETGGVHYTAARVVRRSGRDAKVSTKEARLERLRPGGGTDVVAGAARELLPAVEELLGLGFAHFTRCVVLPQGEFARFLHDKPADRQALLERLLGLGLYDALLRQANMRAAEAKAAADLAQRQLDGMPATDDDTLAAAAERLEALTRLVAAVDGAVEELDRLRRTATGAQDQIAVERRLAAALAAVHLPPEVAEIGDLLKEARADVERAAAQRATTAARLATATEDLRRRPALDALEVAAVAHERIAKGQAVRADRVAALDHAAAAATAADTALATAERAQADAREALDAARRAHAAHDLAGHLVKGEPCPVCAQVVAAVPPRRRPAALATTEKRLAATEEKVVAARSTVAAATDAAHRAAAELAKVDAILTTLAEQVAGHPDADVVATLVAAVRAAVATVESARGDDDLAAKNLAAALDTVGHLETGLARAGDVFHAQRDAVASAGPPAPGPDLLVSWQALTAWAADEVPVVAARTETAEAVAAEASARYDEQVRRLADEAAALGVDAPARPDALAAAVIRAEERATETVRQIESARIEAARVVTEVSHQRDTYRVAHELGRHLASSGFPRWLVTEALDLLVTDASALLLRLSDGKYSLVTVDDGSELGVIDHANADEIRPVRSLSGGETFQASLAFALALSDHLASLASSGAARLDAIFLDEGFGTLDADSLDTVATTIEALGGGGRMVGIVTHVRELAERLPVRYVVAKGSRSARVERVVG